MDRDIQDQVARLKEVAARRFATHWDRVSIRFVPVDSTIQSAIQSADLSARQVRTWANPDVNFAPPASDDEILELERIVAGTLPDDYKAFLRATRRVETSELSIFSPLQAARMHPSEEIPLRLVTGLPDRPAEDDVVPVASDGGGNIYLLGTRGPAFGCVWLWDHEADEPHHGSASSGFASVAASFAEFLAAIHGRWTDEVRFTPGA